MNEITLREQQLIMLDILKKFAEFCEENNLRYFLDAGTLLGAIRHKGFIPWDNDADVCMPRPDLDRFVTLIKRQNYMLSDHIVLERPEDTLFPYFKLGDTRTLMIEYPESNPVECYVYIDIFCKDGLPDNMKKAKRICNKSGKLCLWNWFYKYSLKAWPKGHSFIKKIVACIVKPFVRNKNRALLKQKEFIKKVNQKYPYETCKYVTTLSNGEFYRMCLKSNFDDYIKHKFEDEMFRIPVGYENWLTVLYGNDYMVPPPKEKQLVHNVKVYWRE